MHTPVGGTLITTDVEGTCQVGGCNGEGGGGLYGYGESVGEAGCIAHVVAGVVVLEVVLAVDDFKFPDVLGVFHVDFIGRYVVGGPLHLAVGFIDATRPVVAPVPEAIVLAVLKRAHAGHQSVEGSLKLCDGGVAILVGTFAVVEEVGKDFPCCGHVVDGFLRVLAEAAACYIVIGVELNATEDVVESGNHSGIAGQLGGLVDAPAVGVAVAHEIGTAIGAEIGGAGQAILAGLFTVGNAEHPAGARAAEEGLKSSARMKLPLVS